MALLLLNNLPPTMGKGAIVRLLTNSDAIQRDQIGQIDLRAGQASIEVPREAATNLAVKFDGLTVENHTIEATFHQPTRTEGHFDRLIRLLNLEAEAEAQQSLARRQKFSGAQAEMTGETLLNLTIRSEMVGLGGRILLTLGKGSGRQTLPWHRLHVGTPILLTRESASEPHGLRGVVSHLTAQTIQVAFPSQSDPPESKSYRLDVAHDEVSTRRQRWGLQRVQSAKQERVADLRRVLLGEREPDFLPTEPFTPQNGRLNAVQQQAVKHALSARDVAIIHGPPGTGKTTTLVELICQAVARGERVLACAPSNLAVDNLFEKLLAAGVRVLRVGHPARVLPKLREHTLDLMVEHHPDFKVAQKWMREAYSLRRDASKFKRAKPARGEKQAKHREAKSLLADAHRLESQIVERLLDGAAVICATTTGLDPNILGNRHFDLCVIDEAAQSTEPSLWLPLLRSERVVLAGDHCQLPPTVISPEAQAQGFGISLMERLVTEFPPEIAVQLVVQYRMHEEIMGFSSAQFYDGTLRAHASVAHHLLTDLPAIETSELTDTAVHFIDTAGASFEEEPDPDGHSQLNPSEADVVRRKLDRLHELGVTPNNVAVITPYSAQVRHLNDLLTEHREVEVASVDGFQGREKEVIIISLVRSNGAGTIGFLADTRRMNVALTRARRKLIVIGDSATITGHPFYQALVNYFEQIGAYHSVWSCKRG